MRLEETKLEEKMKDLTFKQGHYSISYDEKSKGYCVSTGHGEILTSKALVELCEGILSFLDTYTDEEIEEANKQNEEVWYANMYTDNDHLSKPYHTCHFKKNGHVREGLVYVYQDKASGHVRAVKTTEQTYENSVRNKQNSSYEGITVLNKIHTKHQNLLWEFFNMKAEHIRNHPEFVTEENYFADLNHWIATKVTITKYKCKKCKDVMSSLERTSYIRCSTCLSNFCSEDCWEHHECKSKTAAVHT